MTLPDRLSTWPETGSYEPPSPSRANINPACSGLWQSEGYHLAAKCSFCVCPLEKSYVRNVLFKLQCSVGNVGLLGGKCSRCHSLSSFVSWRQSGWIIYVHEEFPPNREGSMLEQGRWVNICISAPLLLNLISDLRLNNLKNSSRVFRRQER